MDGSKTYSSENNAQSLLEQWRKKRSVKNFNENGDLSKKGKITAGMQNIWILQQLDLQNPFYQHTEVYKFSNASQINRQKLINAIIQAIRKHEIFRFNFEQDGTEIRYKLNDRIESFNVVDLGNAGDEFNAYDIAKQFGRKPFLLDSDLLIRAGFINLEQDQLWLLISMHHIIGDRDSLDILFSDILKEYKTDDHLQLKTDQSFRDYLTQEISDKPDVDSEFWKEHFKNIPPVLDLDFSNNRDSSPSFTGKTIKANIGKLSSEKIAFIAQNFQTTTYVVLLSLFKYLLSIYSGESHVSIGVPYSQRLEKGFKDTVGYFNKTLVIDTILNSKLTLSDLILKVKENVLSVFAHSNYDYADLLALLNPPRVPGVNPLFQVMYVHNKKSNIDQHGLPFNVEQETLDLGISKLDMTLFSYEKEDGISLRLEYDSNLFDQWHMERLFDHFNQLITKINLDSPNVLNELEIIGEIEKERIANWNNTQAPLPEFKNISAAFQFTVQANKDKIAVVDTAEKITYDHLDKKSSLLAKKILSSTKKGSIIGVLQGRNIDFVISILGVLKSGCIYLPLDPEYPEDRLKFMIEDSKTSLIISDRAPTYIKTPVISVDAEPLKNKLPTDLPEVVQTNTAYIIYTSGSTGNPKGVQVSHENLLASTFARPHFYPQDPFSFLLLSPFSFDSSAAGIFWTLLTGGKLVLARKKLEQEPEALGNTIEKEAVTHTLLLPSLYEVLLETIDNHKLRSLNTVIVAGESCSYNLVEKHFDHLKNCDLYNEYGPTEATVWTIATQLKLNNHHEVPIGQPIANTQIHILNENFKRVPIGVKGQLLLSGKNISKGYLNNSDLTHEKFVKFQNKICYKTGDIVRYNLDGSVLFYGREDQQVKINGHRIELQEINIEVSNIGMSKSSFVSTYQDSKNRKHLVAYIVPNDSYSENTLINHLKGSLPHYMIPKVFIEIDQLPKLPNGKINTELLPSPKSVETSVNRQVLPPQNERQETLTSIWKEVLNLEHVGIDDNFFSLGGDSILSILMASKAKSDGLDIKPNDIFKYQTIRELDVQVGKRNIQFEKSEKIEQINKIELNNLQSAFLINKLSSKNDDGLLFLEFDIEGNIDVKAFENALAKTVNRHDVLRTVIYEEKGVYFQEIKSHFLYTLYQDRVSIDEKELDLETCANMFSLLKINEGRFKLIWKCHHILVDGWSCGVIIKDLLKFYENEGAFSQIQNFPTYLHWIKNRNSAKAKNFWSAYFQKDTILTLLQNEKVSIPEKFENAETIIPEDLQNKIKAFCRRSKVAQSYYFQVVWSLVLSGLFRSRHVSYGLTVSGRNLSFPGIQEMAGLFMNIVPEVVNIPENKEINTWLHELQYLAYEKRRYDHCSLPEIKECLSFKPNQSLFDTLYIYGNFLAENTKIGSLNILNFNGGFSSSYPLTIRIKPLEKTEIIWRFNSNIISKQAIDFIQQEFFNLAELICSNLFLNISEIIKRWNNYPIHFSTSNLKPVKEKKGIEQFSLVNVENLIIEDWTNMLNVKVDNDSNLFMLGGSSLDAVESTSRIANLLNVTLNASVILNHNTPEKLAKFIVESGNSENESEMVVPMKSGNGSEPLFCFHAGGSQVFFYSEFARKIDSNIPVYSIQTPRLNEENSPKSIEDLARIYLTEMRKIKPNGPYRMMGTCFSNTLLVEISHLLEIQGEESNTLLVVDSAPSLSALENLDEKKSRWKKWIKRLQFNNLIRRFERLINPKSEAELISDIFNTEEQDLVETIEILNEMYRQYQWKNINDEVHLIRSSEFANQPRKKFHLEVWSKLTDNQLHVHEVDAQHIKIFEESAARSLAREVNQILQQ
ncbi:non-ribosomal peptide synthetase [Portibacter marinus]|uniref:non-ribosomal peptide synthetase n=1 Tax=Portibacter marinus TaxID=2898660 RepID=UPI001F3D8772|nr:non-ribosomal peptide synthetase [Portibacter marinus]